MELELQNVRQEISHVRDIRRDMILRAGIEIRLTARDRRRDALILQPKRPPRLVVLVGRYLAREYLPSPLIDQQPERQERDLLERLVQQQADILRRIGRLLQQSDLDQ